MTDAKNPNIRAYVNAVSGGSVALETYPVELRRITNDGVSMSMSEDADQVLQAHDALNLTLELPDRKLPCSIACIVRHRDVVDNSVVYSCDYDWGATSDSLGVMEELVEYMLPD
ncbi:MAG: hypothetical protein AAF384_19170 [Pseudomonadota bacterium]